LGAGGEDSNQVTLLNGGNVGIGTDSPSTLLKIEGTSTATGAYAVNECVLTIYNNDKTTANNASGISFNTKSSGDAEYGMGGIYCRFTDHTDGSTNSDIVFYNRLNDVVKQPLTIKDSGNVGIGTTSPDSALEISGSGATNLLKVGEDMLFVSGSGNVGIGTDSPDYKLQVDGDIAPETTNTYDLGSTTKRWANVYAGDLHLQNEVGDWTVEEGEEELFITNNKTGKKYAIMMREIE
jgi:hypothetical protein